MGLTASSTGTKVLAEDVFEKTVGFNFTIGIAGNPNVGKSTVFNGITGMRQHTGNWTGKTVTNAIGNCKHKDKDFLFVDIPGTYSLMSNSEEEEIARNYICFGNADVIVVVVDATSLERNLNLVFQTMEITKNVIVCVNLLDEAKKKGIHIDLELLSKRLGVPVVGTCARKRKTLNNLLDVIYDVCVEKIEVSPITIKYSELIENSINLIVPSIKKLNIKNVHIHRWIALKLIDGDKSIINSLSEHLNIDLSKNLKLKAKIDEAKELLGNSNIDINKSRDIIVSSILHEAEDICGLVCKYNNPNYNERDRKLDKILTSRIFGFPIMIGFLGIIFWITIVGANYPSQFLANLFGIIQDKLYLLFGYIHSPTWVTGVLIDGMYQTLAWVVSVMLPPMAIFFPLFTFLEDLGYLPRIAFNLDKYFKKCCASGKQALSMCMGFGCNAAGIIGCRIINSPRERLIAIITNNFVPCNGRFPFLIIVSSMFIGGIGIGFKASLFSTLTVLFVIILGVVVTFVVSKILSKTVLKGMPSTLTLELPPYRKPQFGKILVRSIFDRTLFVLGRAISVAAPTGVVIWLLANIAINDISLLQYSANFFEPFAKLMGLDGYILTAFILGLPANEIVLPIILMSYLKMGSLIGMDDKMALREILIQNGWTILTAINIMIFILMHFPCATTLLTIKKETKSLKWTFVSFLVPTICGIVLCMITTGVWNVITNFV
ncbi:MAG: ferrous iron transport protein B [Oscillospiraceae bacterium]|nr:ferrous iron transport protein B [Oscillospiraceae bacterium]